MARFSSALLVSFLLAIWLLAPFVAEAYRLESSLRQAQEDGRLTPEEAEGIQARIDQTREQGLPQAPFAAKVEEGLAKRVRAQAIIHALDVIRGDYDFARDTLRRSGAEPTPDDIALTGDSLRLGLTRLELTAMADLNPPPPMLATAARTRAALNAIGFPTPLSGEIMRQGLTLGSLTPGWEQLFRVVQRTREAGIPDVAVADAAARVLADGGSPAELLQELGLTGRDTRHEPGASK
ncbi:hypothetical protein H4684_001148 [Desulfomicrobium macestii]|uniref:Uncharacterized protein n=2 Tax=Desulfomicrobium TaxID=898 RepID=A0A8G2C3W4_DESNO|nr:MULTISPECIES: hypothetical protein [Desulfomicrobium]MBE1424516.1 hypothetical protein [Desulfomicrobium macestii]SFL87737.1 hypothetical protein SAMN05421830_10877 [Desulfomicrobium norvegicum]